MIPSPSSNYAQLDEARDELDRLLRELGMGIRSQVHFDELEERAQAISRKVRTAFRERL